MSEQEREGERLRTEGETRKQRHRDIQRYRVTKTYRMAYLYRSLSAKEPYN
jgi:hypothetical protein